MSLFRVEITIVLIEDDKLLSGSDAVEELNNNVIKQRLEDAGYIIDNFTAGKVIA